MVFTVVEAGKDMTGLAALAAELQATVNSDYGNFALRHTLKNFTKERSLFVCCTEDIYKKVLQSSLFVLS